MTQMDQPTWRRWTYLDPSLLLEDGGMAPTTLIPPSCDELRRALVRDELAAWYQPLISLADGSVAGLEALARWQHPRLGLLPAAAFVPLAEQCGLLAALDALMWHDAFARFAGWQARGQARPELRLTINLRQSEPGRRSVSIDLARAMEHGDIDPALVTVDVVRPQGLDDADETDRIIEELDEIGVEVAMDDVRAPTPTIPMSCYPLVRRIKADPAMTSGALSTVAGRSSARALVRVARRWRMTVVAEGVENAEQAHCARELGCLEGQGTFWMAAVPADQAERLLLV
jgi:EAL domain-containing protein (putative c-di-GMP-specific phosphodiesterase class I)